MTINKPLTQKIKNPNQPSSSPRPTLLLPISPPPGLGESEERSTATMHSTPPRPPPQHHSPEYVPPPRPSHPGASNSSSLYKQKSWSPDSHRDEAWQRRKGSGALPRTRSKSVTDEDLEELKACIELGFGFDSPEMDKRLSDTLPAYELYYAVNKHYTETVLKPSPPPPPPPAAASPLSSAISDSDTPSPLGSPLTIFGPGENPQTVKTRLRQWAQVVACTVRQSSTRSS